MPKPSGLAADQMDQIEREITRQYQLDAERKKRQQEADQALNALVAEIEQGKQTEKLNPMVDDDAAQRTLDAIATAYAGGTAERPASSLTPEQMEIEEKLKAARDEADSAMATLDRIADLASNPRAAAEAEAKEALDKAEQIIKQGSQKQADKAAAVKREQEDARRQLDMVADAMQKQAGSTHPSEEEKKRILDQVVAGIQAGGLDAEKAAEKAAEAAKLEAEKALEEECARVKREMEAGGAAQLQLEADMKKKEEESRRQAETDLERESQRIMQEIEEGVFATAKKDEAALRFEEETNRIMDSLTRELAGAGFDFDSPTKKAPTPRRARPRRAASQRRLMASADVDSAEGRALRVLICLGSMDTKLVDTGSKTPSVLVDGEEVCGMGTVCRTLGLAAKPPLYPSGDTEALIAVDGALEDALQTLQLVGALRREVELAAAAGGVLWRTLTWPLRLAAGVQQGGVGVGQALEKVVLQLRRIDGGYFHTDRGEFMVTDTPSVCDAVLAVVVEELCAIGLDPLTLRLRHVAYFRESMGEQKGYRVAQREGRERVAQNTDRDQRAARVVREAAQAGGFARRA
eukprot:Hpha_TRINITY_DN5267_c0_g1::TRINITY_DN5267_c0_g1_i1::g.116595::m.116595